MHELTHYKQTPEHMAKRIASRRKNNNAWHSIKTRNKIKNTILAKENYASWNQKYKLNENIFNELDSPEKAYWLGFIYADGNIYKNILSITLHKNDKSHLEKFKQFLQADILIRLEDNRGCFIVNRKKIVLALKKLGITPCKSLCLKFPKINQLFYPDFIRGYFDGDGMLRLMKPKKGNGQKSQLNFNICSGTKCFLERIQKILMEKCNLNKTKITGKMEKNSYDLNYVGNNQVPRIFSYLLQNSNVKLERKYIPLMEI